MKQKEDFEVTVKLSKEAVAEIVKPYKDVIDSLEKRIQRLLDNAESVKIRELEIENAHLKHLLEMSPVTFDSEKELKAYKKFCKKHEKCQLSAKANGGKVPYIVLNGTGVGTCKKVICQVCGKWQDITDISVW